jgi:HD superfamily phosphohydrolase
MVNTYTVVDNDLGLSSNGLSTIENFLKGRIQIYMWVTQHHKVIYTNELMREMIREVVNELDENPFTVENIAERGLDDHFVLQKIRKKAHETSNEILNHYYERYRNRNYHESCWKHIIDFKEKIGSKKARDAIFDNIDSDNDIISKHLSKQLEVPEYDILTGVSYVPGFTHSDLESIYVDYGGSSKPLTEFGIYNPRKGFVRPVPYVFVPEGKVEKSLEILRDISLKP